VVYVVKENPLFPPRLSAYLLVARTSNLHRHTHSSSSAASASRIQKNVERYASGAVGLEVGVEDGKEVGMEVGIEVGNEVGNEVG
jgi:hypothetical protein